MTGTQLETARFIYFFSRRRGFPPTVQELASEFGVCRTAIVCRIVKMQRDGIIKRTEGRREYRELFFTDEFKKSKEYQLFKLL